MAVPVRDSALQDAGAAFMRRGLPIAALHAWSAWLREAESEGDPTALVRASNALAAAHAAIRDEKGAEQRLKAALDIAQNVAVPTDDRVKTCLNLALNLYRSGQLEGALAAALEAREICNVGTSLPLAARVQVTLSGLHVARGDWDAAAQATLAAEALAGVIHDTSLLSRALNNRAMVLLNSGKAREAERALGVAIRLASQAGRDADLPFHYTEMAHVKLRLGEVQAALEWGTRALDAMWSNVGLLDEAEVARLSRLFGLVAWEAGEREQSIVWLNRAASYYAQSGLMAAWKEVSDLLAGVLSAPGPRRRGARVHMPPVTRDRIHYITSLLSLSDSISSMQPRLGLHSALVTQYALRLGEAMDLTPEVLEVLSHAGRFHDIGKIVVAMPALPRRDDVIGHPDDERVLLHPKTGRDMLAMFPLPAGVIDAVAHHHERWDGGGYPDGLSGERIPVAARVIAVANLYISLTYDAHPTPPFSHAEALARMGREAGAGLDPDGVATFLRLHGIPASPHGKEANPE